MALGIQAFANVPGVLGAFGVFGSLALPSWGNFDRYDLALT